MQHKNNQQFRVSGSNNPQNAVGLSAPKVGSKLLGAANNVTSVLNSETKME
jgi:hypothetical protein